MQTTRYLDPKFKRVYTAIIEVKLFLDFLPAESETIIFNLGYARLKIWRYTNNMLWVGLINPHCKQPKQDDLIHISLDQFYAIAYAGSDE